MTMAEESMAKSLRKIANVLESEEVQPRILREVEILIRKFPTAEALTSLKTTSPITKCPPDILEEILAGVSILPYKGRNLLIKNSPYL